MVRKKPSLLNLHLDLRTSLLEMKSEKLCCSFQWIALCFVLLESRFVCSNHHGNAANDLLETINKNRTAYKLPKLNDNPGLGCIALQYAQECKGNCSSNNTIHCHPQEDDFTEVFAPNCGVELPTFGTISGYILGCHKKYLQPIEAFSDVLFQDQKALSLLRNRTIGEVGVGIIGSHKHKGPYVWCVLFSNNRANTTFVLEDLGKGIEQKRGCYSGTSLPCSEGHRKSEWLWWSAGGRAAVAVGRSAAETVVDWWRGGAIVKE